MQKGKANKNNIMCIMNRILDEVIMVKNIEKYYTAGRFEKGKYTTVQAVFEISKIMEMVLRNLKKKLTDDKGKHTMYIKRCKDR